MVFPRWTIFVNLGFSEIGPGTGGAPWDCNLLLRGTGDFLLWPARKLNHRLGGFCSRELDRHRPRSTCAEWVG